MSTRLVLVCLTAALFVGACGSETPTPAAKVSPTPMPNIEATVVAEVQARLRSAATQAPLEALLSSTDRQGIVNFATAHRKIIRDWEEFHVVLDAWRRGLDACDASSVEVTLIEFASAMESVAVLARTMPRSTDVRELDDKLIVAAESEAEALRQLRDSWQPGDPTVFEQVDTARSASLAQQREVQDALSDLQKRTSPEARALVASFGRALEDISSDWDIFRSSYDSFRTQEPSLSSLEVVNNLG